MIIGKYIRTLLEERKRVILAGFGNLELIEADGSQKPSGNRLNPPGTSIRFDASFNKDDGALAEAVAAGELVEREEAEQRVLELVDAIRFSLDKGEDFLLPEAGVFFRDTDGKVHFRVDPAWVLEPDQYGLESMDLLELEELPVEEEPVKSPGTESKTSSGVTELAPPKPKPKPKRWRLIWIVAATLIVVLVVLIVIPSEEQDGKEERRFFNKKPDREVVEEQDPGTDQLEEETEQDVADAETELVEPDPEPEAEQALPVEETNNFFLIAGSFNKLKNASDLQDKLNNRGYNAEVMITENRMYRVSVASYATKLEAERALNQIKSEPGLESCWLLSN